MCGNHCDFAISANISVLTQRARAVDKFSQMNPEGSREVGMGGLYHFLICTLGEKNQNVVSRLSSTFSE